MGKKDKPAKDPEDDSSESEVIRLLAAQAALLSTGLTMTHAPCGALITGNTPDDLAANMTAHVAGCKK